MMAIRPTSALIDELATQLRPVHRLSPPWLRALGWLLLAALLGAVFAAFANMAEVRYRLMAMPDQWLGALGCVLTAILAALAAFQLSVPDRSSAWVFAPLPGIALWVAASCMGIMRPDLIPGVRASVMMDGLACFRFILMVSVPLSAAALLMLRRAHPLRPGLTGAMGGLAAAAVATLLLTMYHAHDTALFDFVAQVLTIGLVVTGNKLLGGRVLNGPSNMSPNA